MNIEEIRALKNAQPFRPFDILTSDGRTMRIPFPHRIAFSPRGDSVACFAEDGSFYLMMSQITGVRAGRTRKAKCA